MAEAWILEPNSEFDSWFCHLLVMWLGANQVTSWRLICVNCKMGIVIIPNSTRVFAVNLMCLYHFWGLLCIEKKLGSTIPRISSYVRCRVESAKERNLCLGRRGVAAVFQRRPSLADVWAGGCEVQNGFQLHLSGIACLWAAGRDS